MTQETSRAYRVVVIDDEKTLVDAVQEILEDEGYETSGVTDPREAFQKIQQVEPHCVLLDLRMPYIDGHELFDRIRRFDPDLPVIILTAHGDTRTAVEFVKAGAFEFLLKPFDIETLQTKVRNAVRQYELVLSKRASEGWGGPPRLLGQSEAMHRLREQIERASRTQSTVLILGESGSGKELVAWEIHQRSARKAGPFVRVNCAAIPKELIESELFGHRKGAFTGAVRDQKGKFEQADEGTIFLDEIGDMSLEAQAKILRVLETGEIEPIGEGKPRHVNVRVIAATNKDIQSLIREKKFREDLYYRVAVLIIRVPPLREHPEDLPFLVEHFTEEFTRQNGLPHFIWDQDALAFLQGLKWPGNIRQLKHFVEYCCAMHRSPVLTRDDVERYWNELQQAYPDARTRPSFELQEPAPSLTPRTIEDIRPLRKVIEEIEREYILKTLELLNWNVSQTAKILRIPRSNLYKKLEKYDINIRKGIR